MACRHREVGMDDWAWEQLAPWLDARVELPVGPLFCVVNRPRTVALGDDEENPTRQSKESSGMYRRAGAS
jgi:hypothetical protein